jgi:hypothetical protein
MAGEKQLRLIAEPLIQNITIISPELFQLFTAWIPPAILEKAAKKVK